MAGFDRKNIIKGNNSFYLQLGKGMRKKPKSPGVGAVFCMVSVRGREKKELHFLERRGIIRRCYATEWGSAFRESLGRSERIFPASFKTVFTPLREVVRLVKICMFHGAGT